MKQNYLQLTISLIVIVTSCKGMAPTTTMILTKKDNPNITAPIHCTLSYTPPSVSTTVRIAANDAGSTKQLATAQKQVALSHLATLWEPEFITGISTDIIAVKLYQRYQQTKIPAMRESKNYKDITIICNQTTSTNPKAPEVRTNFCIPVTLFLDNSENTILCFMPQPRTQPITNLFKLISSMH